MMEPAAAPSTIISCRGTKGIQTFDGKSYSQTEDSVRDSSKVCKFMVFSPRGSYLAWGNGTVIKVVETCSWKTILEIPRAKASGAQFSPLEHFLSVWEPFHVKGDNLNNPNLDIWSLESKSAVKSYVQKNHSKWAPNWSDDESLLSRNLNQELQIYETSKMDAIAQRTSDFKVDDYSISPGNAPYYFVCFVKGTKGQPSFARLYRYPNFTASGLIASKSFFQGDHVEMKWNSLGNAVLLMTSTDVDTSGASYYGKQTLHFLDTKGTSAMVQLNKQGPIYSFEWNPTGNEFCVVYGFMPAKATLFDTKCNPKFDFGTGPWNSIYFNPFGNPMLLLGGFGNLRGQVEIWSPSQLKKISAIEAADTTLLQWCPDGQRILTATTAPRLRVGNGFKVWHYSGSLLHENHVSSPDELWDAAWQPCTKGSFTEFKVVAKKVAGIQPSQPQVSKELYRPPGARGMPAPSRFLEERERPSVPRAGNPDILVSNTKPKDAPKKKQDKKSKAPKTNEAPKVEQAEIKVILPPSNITIQLTGNEETDKKLKDLKKKLDQIARLKAEQEAGKKMELNQLEKISKEEEFRQEFEKLQLKK